MMLGVKNTQGLTVIGNVSSNDIIGTFWAEKYLHFIKIKLHIDNEIIICVGY